MRSLADFEEARRLLAAGRNHCEVARCTGIPRTTVRDWAHRGHPPGTGFTHGVRRRSCMRCSPNGAVWNAFQRRAYAYLLGLYLGDGCLLSHPRGVKRLSIALDLRYPVIIAECEAAISIVMPDNKVRAQPMQRGARGVHLNSLSKHWPCLFPQHGPGLKHRRSIVLEPWQREIVELHPGRFVRGLIHSDGSRSTNTIRHPKKTYVYPRYEFSNRSDQIRGMFVWACSLLGVEAKPMGRWNVSVARRELVAILDRHVGPKR